MNSFPAIPAASTAVDALPERSIPGWLGIVIIPPVPPIRLSHTVESDMPNQPRRLIAPIRVKRPQWNASFAGRRR